MKPTIRSPVARQRTLDWAARLIMAALQAATRAGVAPATVDHLLDALRAVESEQRVAEKMSTRAPGARALG
ncbi:MAG TPA: hypothetical protein DHW63_03585 [Hyphomonadaceae bacterium]|nr:hypothetical protein [Hyphomonadaceae bacterium]